VPGSISRPLMQLLSLSKSRIRQLITLEGMPTQPDEARLWYDAKAKKNPTYKRGPAKHQEMLQAGARVAGTTAVVAESSVSVTTGLLQHALGGISAVRVGQLKLLGMPTDSLANAVEWRKSRITDSNHTAGALTKTAPAPLFFANEFRARFDAHRIIILADYNWRVNLHGRIVRMLEQEKFGVAMVAAVAGSLHLVVTRTEQLHVILLAMQHGLYRDASRALTQIKCGDCELAQLLSLVCALRTDDSSTRDVLAGQDPFANIIVLAAANDDTWRDRASGFRASAQFLVQYGQIAQALDLLELAGYMFERALGVGCWFEPTFTSNSPGRISLELDGKTYDFLPI
jgi:hypothetical protein